MLIKVFKEIVNYTFRILLVFSFCTPIIADTTPEQQIVEINGIRAYKLVADELVSIAKSKSIKVTEFNEVDKYTAKDIIKINISNSRLSIEIADLYKNAMLNNSDDAIVYVKNIDKDGGEGSILELMQVNKNRGLITGIRVSRGK